jgi:hypothetical protein
MDIYLLRKWKHGHGNSYVLILSARPAYKLQAADGKIHELLALTVLDPANILRCSPAVCIEETGLQCVIRASQPSGVGARAGAC